MRRKITDPKYPNVNQVGTDVDYEGKPRRITGVGGSYFTLIRHRDGYGMSDKIRDVNGS